MEHINPNNVDINVRRRRQSSQNPQVTTEVDCILMLCYNYAVLNML